jgi:hypothetical protein
MGDFFRSQAGRFFHSSKIFMAGRGPVDCLGDESFFGDACDETANRVERFSLRSM